MEHRSARRGALWGLVLVGGCCALPAGEHRDSGHCTQGVCKAEVTVQSCETGAMSVMPEPIPVPEPNNIEWTIKTPGYSFPENGIVIAGTGFEPRPGVNGNGRKFTVHDDHTDRRPRIKYTVNLTRQSDGVACAPFDPFINNN